MYPNSIGSRPNFEGPCTQIGFPFKGGPLKGPQGLRDREGSMYPNSIYFGLKVVPISVLWGQSIYYLGTWTLRVVAQT